MKALMFILSLTLMTGLAEARPMRHPRHPQRYPAHQADSFRGTCDVFYEDTYEIQAYCQDTYGRLIYNDFTEKAYCQADIANIDGYLQCTGNTGTPNPPPPGNWPSQGQLPAGSYEYSCQSCQADSVLLACNCLDSYGYTHYTSLNYRTCRSDIANVNGRLMCR